MSDHKTFTSDEAKAIGDKLGIDWSAVNLEEFRVGLSIELEHGSHDPETDVIGDDELLSGKIAWAHLKELPDYYTRLEKMEAEGEKMQSEEFKVDGQEVKDKVKEIIKSGNARRIIVKDQNQKTILEIPLTVGVIGAVIAPVLAAVGAAAAVATSCTIIVEKSTKDDPQEDDND